MNKKSLFLPTKNTKPNYPDVCRWFNNIVNEIVELDLTKTEEEALINYYYNAGLLNPKRIEFFRWHYCRHFTTAAKQLDIKPEKEFNVLDLGGGSGTQALFFALMGAKVVVADMDTTALSILRKRIDLYQEKTQKDININIIEGNVFDIKFDRLDPFDLVYSLFAFNMMQPTNKLVEILSNNCKKSALAIIQDGNPKHFYNRIFRKRPSLDRKNLNQAFEKNGFETLKNIGGYAIPPFMWKALPHKTIKSIDPIISKADCLSVSYLHIYRKRTT